MGRTNLAKNFPGITTHGGSPAKRISNEAQLRRSVLSCFLWEKEFYESGFEIAKRINETASLCSVQFVSDLAVEARTVHGLRHVPLLLLLNLIMVKRTGDLLEGPRVRDTIAKVISRPDEMTELLSMYWIANGGRKETAKLSKQLQRGLAQAFLKFDEYSLAKYNRDGPVRLRDVLFLSRAKPPKEKEELFKRVADDTLVTPDTWEVELSAGKDKKETFERLIREGKLGYMALLRNLRNMEQAGCDPTLVKKAIVDRKGARYVLPFRYTAAARHAPRFEGEIDLALRATIQELPRLPGRTIVLVDVSGSMDYYKVSAKSELTRADAAATLAAIINAEDLRVITFSLKNVEVPARRGMAGVDAILRSQQHNATHLRAAVEHANSLPHDRLIVITDEQGTDGKVPDPVAEKAYMINVASYQNGVGYGKWTQINGFSESVVRFIYEIERDE